MTVLTGKGIGRGHLTGSGRVGGSSSEASVWTSTTALACVVVGGAVGSRGCR